MRVLLQVLEGFLEPNIVGERDMDGQFLVRKDNKTMKICHCAITLGTAVI